MKAVMESRLSPFASVTWCDKRGTGLLGNVILGHPVAKRVASNLEQPACLRNVPCRLPECFLQIVLFHFLKREAER